MKVSRANFGAGIISLCFSAMYIGFAVAANVYAFGICQGVDPNGVAVNTLRLGAVLMDIAAASLCAFSICWVVRSRTGWKQTTASRFFWWMCLNALIMFTLPPALNWDAVSIMPRGFDFMAFTPVLNPVVMIITAGIAMTQIIKQKNGGTLRKRR